MCADTSTVGGYARRPRPSIPVCQAEREVSAADGAEWARSKGMMFLEASAKTEKCITQVFDEVVQKVRSGTSYCL